MQTAHDIYPSRTGGDAQIIERADPVVYAPAGTPPPIAPPLVDSYREEGFLVLPEVFSAAEVAAMQDELDALRRNELLLKRDEVILEPDSRDVRSIFMIHRLSRLFRELAADPRLAGLASYLLDDEVYVHQSRLNYKPGFRGREFYWHSDFETWHVEDGMPRMRALSMSVTLTPNTPENGPLMLIPGSHRTYIACAGETPENHFRTSLRRQEYGVPPDALLAQMVERGGLRTATGAAGSVVVFDCNVMHGSNSNITPLPRSNAFFVFNAISNRVEPPFSGQKPRPEYICSREHVSALDPRPWRPAS